MAVKKKASPLDLEKTIEKALIKAIPSLVEDIINDQDDVWEVLSKGITKHMEEAITASAIQQTISDRVLAAVGKISDNDIKKLVMQKLLR